MAEFEKSFLASEQIQNPETPENQENIPEIVETEDQKISKLVGDLTNKIEIDGNLTDVILDNIRALHVKKQALSTRLFQMKKALGEGIGTEQLSQLENEINDLEEHKSLIIEETGLEDYQVKSVTEEYRLLGDLEHGNTWRNEAELDDSIEKYLNEAIKDENNPLFVKKEELRQQLKERLINNHKDRVEKAGKVYIDGEIEVQQNGLQREAEKISGFEQAKKEIFDSIPPGGAAGLAERFKNAQKKSKSLFKGNSVVEVAEIKQKAMELEKKISQLDYKIKTNPDYRPKEYDDVVSKFLEKRGLGFDKDQGKININDLAKEHEVTGENIRRVENILVSTKSKNLEDSKRNYEQYKKDYYENLVNSTQKSQALIQEIATVRGLLKEITSTK